MIKSEIVHAAVLAVALSSLAGAQSPAVPNVIADDLFVSLHSHAGDPSYGVWAGGAEWKARFDGGFTYFPRVGHNAPRNLPWTFKVDGVRQGDGFAAASEDAAGESFAGDRFQRDHGRFVERYDVRVDGVEQSFVVALPLGQGDLVVEGTVSSELTADATGWRHGALEFRDAEGRDTLRYGAAFAIDASGRRVQVDTAWEQGRLRLRVPSWWVADAQWPITIDPLTQTTTLVSFIDDIRTIGVARSRQYSELCNTYTREFALNDHDLYVRTMADDFSGRQTVYTDFANDRDTEHVSVDYVAGAARYVVAFDVQNGNDSFIRLHFHPGGVGNGQPGTDVDYNPGGIHARRAPTFGGCADSQTDGYLVLRRDLKSLGANGESSRVFGAVVDASAMTIGAFSDLHTSATTNYDAEWPCVSRESIQGDGWVVVWQEYNFDNSNDDWDIIAQRIGSDGTLLGLDVLGPDGDATLHKLRPKVAGTRGRFAVAYTTTLNSGTKPVYGYGLDLRVSRFNWQTTSGNAFQVHGVSTIDSAPVSTLLLDDGNSALTYDYEMASHWALSWTELGVDQRIARLGYDARVAESTILQVQTGSSYGFHGANCYDADSNRFVVISSTSGGTAPMYGRHFEYAAATTTAYGASCSGTLSFRSSGTPWLPHAGLEQGRLYLQNALPSAPTWLMLSVGPADLPLPLGVSGCRLLLDPNILLLEYAAVATDSVGFTQVPVSLPSTLHFANLYWQVLQLDGGLLRSSNAVATEVR